MLLTNLDNSAHFAGNLHQDPKYSFINITPTKGMVSLYLIEAIRVGSQQPHQTPLLLDTTGVVMPENAFARASEAYRAWWNSLPDQTTGTLRSAADPLEGAGLTWK